ncbi:haloacid dehalogenase-like hydrolase [Virgisporangium ochraceum]|uniref:Haloacid dehalogenase n=1 Tax=Virgisporangium ochraceum TaxID=65505 RepID=A0A8J4EAW7_9ACTN|nr:haloacid dehalogenase-like hydrolase [Virgisporangium ochraceum]GIJ67974.1 haloacid dehalogenase [Virgisporangium ochraceum]
MASGNGDLTLVLWDIDHTLIETRGLGGEFYQRAFEKVTGRRMEQKADVTGQTEPAILAATLELHGLDDSSAYQEAYAESLADEYLKHSDELLARGRALPGAREILAALAERDDVVQTVLSGNLRAVSAIKLRTFDLDRYLDITIGAYGDDDRHRPRLVAVAQGRAAERHGAEFGRGNTVVVGDSTHDVATAVEGGASIVAVASGSSDEEALTQAGATIVLPDLADTERVLAAVIGGPRA